MLVASDPAGFGQRWRAAFPKPSLIPPDRRSPDQRRRLAAWTSGLADRQPIHQWRSIIGEPSMALPTPIGVRKACASIGRRPGGSGPGRRWLGWGNTARGQFSTPSPTACRFRDRLFGRTVRVSPVLAEQAPCDLCNPGAFRAAKAVDRQRASRKYLRFAKIVPKGARGVFSDTAAGSAAVSIK